MKRTSHITLVLNERTIIKESKDQGDKKNRAEKPELKAKVQKSEVKAKKKK